MSPSRYDNVECKATGRPSCLGVLNIVGDMIPAAVVEARPGARGWYCGEHGGREMDRRARQRTFFETTGKRCSLCGDSVRVMKRTVVVEGPDALELVFCSDRCSKRWEKSFS